MILKNLRKKTLEVSLKRIRRKIANAALPILTARISENNESTFAKNQQHDKSEAVQKNFQIQNIRNCKNCPRLIISVRQSQEMRWNMR